MNGVAAERDIAKVMQCCKSSADSECCTNLLGKLTEWVLGEVERRWVVRGRLEEEVEREEAHVDRSSLSSNLSV